MYKATVVALALECFLKKMNWWQYIRVTDSFDVLSYAFTEDCPPEAKKEFLKIINRLRKEDGAQGVILGCTEIPLLIKQEDLDIPVFDTTAIHSAAAVEYSLNVK